MTVPSVLTYADAIDLLVGFARGQGRLVPQTLIRAAIEAAYEDTANAHHWSFLEGHDRIFLNARQTTGSVVYDYTGGTYERELTLADATWPDWCVDATVRFGDSDYVCEIDQKKSSTVLTLDATLNPGQDVASTAYTLYERWKLLPADFLSFTGPMAESSWQLGASGTMTEIIARDKYTVATGHVERYAVAEAPGIYDRKALFFVPQQTEARTVDFVYKRRARMLRYTGHDAICDQGTVSVSSGSASVTGTDTAFTSGMVGSIIRFGSTSGTPSGTFGSNAYGEERSIIAVASTTALTLDAEISSTYSGAGYCIADPIDLGRVARNAFLRRCEYHLAVLAGYGISGERSSGLQRTLRERSQEALLEAEGADNQVDYDPIAYAPWPPIRVGSVGD